MRLIASVLTVLVISTCPNASPADDSPKRSPELQVLDRFVGTWDMEVTVKPANGEKTTFEVVSTRTWSVAGEVLRIEEPNLNRPELREIHLLLTYDSNSGNYLGVFLSVPGRGFVTGTWNENTQTMTSRMESADGIKHTVTQRFIDKDHAEVSVVTRSAHGQVLAEIAMKQTRRKK